MAKDKTIVSESRTSKRLMRLEIEERMTAVLGDLQKELGDKKFRQRVKKAAKLLSHGTKVKEKAEDKTLKVKFVETKPIEEKNTFAPKKATQPQKATLKKSVGIKKVISRK